MPGAHSNPRNRTGWPKQSSQPSPAQPSYEKASRETDSATALHLTLSQLELYMEVKGIMATEFDDDEWLKQGRVWRVEYKEEKLLLTTWWRPCPGRHESAIPWWRARWDRRAWCCARDARPPPCLLRDRQTLIARIPHFLRFNLEGVSLSLCVCPSSLWPRCPLKHFPLSPARTQTSVPNNSLT